MHKSQQPPKTGPMTSDLKALTECVYVDDEHLYFSVSNLIRAKGLPNTQRQRRSMAEQIKSIWPEVWILEEDDLQVESCGVDVLQIENVGTRFSSFSWLLRAIGEDS